MPESLYTLLAILTDSTQRYPS